jgi:aryl-alcohol dehydrogenase-like predicted oxidoreductase
MRMRNLGDQGLRVPAIGLGCMGMSTAYGERDDESSTRAIHRAIELGAGFLDTSDAYGNGVNEELVGKAIAGKRDRVILASKFGNIRLPDGGREIVGRPDYVPQACDASLKRLGVDHIDLYYQHRVDPTVPIEDTVGAMARLIEAGKVRYLGLSEAGPETIRRANATHSISALQSEYSLWCRDLEADVLSRIWVPTCWRKTGATIILASIRKISRKTSSCCRFWRKSRPRRAARRDNLPLHGCWRRARISCRFRGPSRRPTWMKISAPWKWFWTTRT